MEDFILDDVDELNQEYRLNARFHNFFHASSTTFEIILNMIGLKITKHDTILRKTVVCSVNFNRLTH